MDWSAYPNFSKKEFACKHTGACEMTPIFMRALQVLRTSYGTPFIITSGYRHATHPIEARKDKPGAHAHGVAADIALAGSDAYGLLNIVFGMGCWTGIGVQQKGKGRFIHLDMATSDMLGGAPRPHIWSY